MDREDTRDDYDDSSASNLLSVPKPRRKASTTDHFAAINEKPVDDISLQFFYKPHTVTLLTCAILLILYTAFTRLHQLNNSYGVTHFYFQRRCQPRSKYMGWCEIFNVFLFDCECLGFPKR